MIRANAALTRQAQDFFHTHLVGLFRWDETKFAPPEKDEPVAPALWDRNRRGRRVRPERQGKYHDRVELEFGIWRLTIEGPNEHPPLGWLTLEAHEIIEGPLDPATWKQFGEHIRENHREIENAAVT